MFKDKVLLILGGSGSLGLKLSQVLLQRYPEIKKIIIYSRNKQKQAEAARLLQNNPKLKFYLGDILHSKKLIRAMQGVDYVVDAVEYNWEQVKHSPYGFLRMYLDGTQNLIEAALRQNVAKVLLLSTQQACNFTDISGVARFSAEKLIIGANEISSQSGKPTQFAVLRYGKAISGPNDIIGQFRKQRETGCLSLEDANATRYWFTPANGVTWLLKSLAGMRGGELIVPQVPSVRLLDVAQAICPQCQLKLIERQGNYQPHEVLITPAEGGRTLEYSDHYLIQPDFVWWDSEAYQTTTGGRKVAEGFSYSSAGNNFALNGEELRILLRVR